MYSDIIFKIEYFKKELYFSVNVKGYKRFALKDYPGFDIQKFSDYNIQKCAEECNNRQGCSGYAFVFRIDDCFIKHTVKATGKNFKPHREVDLFIRTAGPTGKIYLTIGCENN